MNRGKKGTTLVQAAFVLPVVFFCVFAVFSYGTFLYGEVKTQGDTHDRLREEGIRDGIISRGEAEFIREMDLLFKEE